jgi:hypothetical protein
MLYRLYCSSGNHLGPEGYLAYSEIDDDGHWVRHLEIQPDGAALRYSREHPAGAEVLPPERPWDDAEASNAEHGVVVSISAELFNALWTVMRCANAGQKKPSG